MKPRFVLDAWAVLALLQAEEPAAAQVRSLLHQAEGGEAELFLSVINLGEVYYRTGRARGEDRAADVLDDMDRLALGILPATNERVLAAARFKMDFAVSYADAFAATAAQELEAILVTGDPELTALTDGLTVEPLSRAPQSG